MISGKLLTGLERVTVLYCLVVGTLAINAAFYGQDGNETFAGEIVIGIITAILLLPLSLCIKWLFQKSGPEVALDANLLVTSLDAWIVEQICLTVFLVELQGINRDYVGLNTFQRLTLARKKRLDRKRRRKQRKLMEEQLMEEQSTRMSPTARMSVVSVHFNSVKSKRQAEKQSLTSGVFGKTDRDSGKAGGMRYTAHHPNVQTTKVHVPVPFIGRRESIESIPVDDSSPEQGETQARQYRFMKVSTWTSLVSACLFTALLCWACVRVARHNKWFSLL